MKLLTAAGEIIAAKLTTDHPASSYGSPVLVIGDGLAVGKGETHGLRLAEASGDEIAALIAAGYAVDGAVAALSGPDDTI